MKALAPQKPDRALAHRLLTDRELSERWQKHVMTLSRMRRDGVLPFVRIGKSPRYKLEDILRIEGGAL